MTSAIIPDIIVFAELKTERAKSDKEMTGN